MGGASKQDKKTAKKVCFATIPEEKEESPEPGSFADLFGTEAEWELFEGGQIWEPIKKQRAFTCGQGDCP